MYIIAARPAPLGDASVVLAGLVVFYGLFFLTLGITEIVGLDLRQVGNLAIAVALVPLFWWPFFDGGWMFHSILIVWVVAFLAIAGTTYGKIPARLLGVILLITAGLHVLRTRSPIGDGPTDPLDRVRGWSARKAGHPLTDLGRRAGIHPNAQFTSA